MSLGHSRSCLTVLALAGFIGMHEPAAAQTPGPPTGRLSCTVGAGFAAIAKSQKPLDCRFRPRRGPAQHYIGIVRQYGLDLGSIRGTRMAWHVYGPYARAPLGALNGSYAASAQAGAAGGSPLVGGEDNKVTLQPRVAQTLRGFNAAIGVTQSELILTRSGSRRR